MPGIIVLAFIAGGPHIFVGFAGDLLFPAGLLVASAVVHQQAQGPFTAGRQTGQLRQACAAASRSARSCDVHQSGCGWLAHLPSDRLTG